MVHTWHKIPSKRTPTWGMTHEMSVGWPVGLYKQDVLVLSHWFNTA
jgi:hypothetical protein